MGLNFSKNTSQVPDRYSQVAKVGPNVTEAVIELDEDKVELRNEHPFDSQKLKESDLPVRVENDLPVKVEPVAIDSQTPTSSVENAKSIPSNQDLQELRFDNLKSLLAKSSRYAELLLVKVKNDEEKQSSKRGRKRKTNENGGTDSKKRRNNAANCPMLSRTELETLAAGEGQPKDDKEDEHLQEFDEPKNFTG